MTEKIKKVVGVSIPDTIKLVFYIVPVAMALGIAMNKANESADARAKMQAMHDMEMAQMDAAHSLKMADIESEFKKYVEDQRALWRDNEKEHDDFVDDLHGIQLLVRDASVHYENINENLNEFKSEFKSEMRVLSIKVDNLYNPSAKEER